MESTYCINGFFFLKFVLSTGRAIIKTLRDSNPVVHGNLLLIDELLVCRNRVMSAAVLRWAQRASHLGKLLVDGLGA
jgi:hypothetical protein